MQTATPARAHAHVWQALAHLSDPEIPVVTLEELGILREVREVEGRLQVVITPTYSGCPAMSQIEDDVRATLAARRIDADVVTQLAPAWTTDWMTAQARRKLRAYGIAPPQTSVCDAADASLHTPTAVPANPDAASHASTSTSAAARALRFVAALDTTAVPCPHCGSRNTTETSAFGSTACKSLHKCLDCLEPFDHFKPH